jgi:hypothetical protein
MIKVKIKHLDHVDVALLDDKDDDLDTWRYSWSMAGGKAMPGQKAIGKYPAIRRVIDGRSKTIFMHMIVAHRMGLIPDPFTHSGKEQGKWDVSVDHDNGNKLDCRRGNLKIRTRSSQMLNPSDGARSTSRSGIRGVILARPGKSKPWNVQATLKGKNYNLGWFAAQEEAIRQRRAFDTAPDKQAWLDALLASRHPSPPGSSPG